MKPVTRKQDEDFKHLMRRFVQSVRKEGIVYECQRRKYYKKPGERRRAKHNAAIKRKNRAKLTS